MKRALIQVIPWLITLAALYIAFRDIEWDEFFRYAVTASPPLLLGAIGATFLSYLLRARRWQYLFPGKELTYLPAVKVLFLGFFMNNILPARTGELVRAHTGAKITDKRRTLVLATIAAERLADGLMLSALFVLVSFSFGRQELENGFFYVAALFGVVALGVAGTLFFQQRLFSLLDLIDTRLDNKASHYLTSRGKMFLEGLRPMFALNMLPRITIWSLAIWLVELSVYLFIVEAFNANMSLAGCVLFMVSVNFSSLIPAAPGGIGVIEAVTAAVLVSLGILKELALPMVVTQHVIQYLVVGVPGLIVLLTWRSVIQAVRQSMEEQEPLEDGIHG